MSQTLASLVLFALAFWIFYSVRQASQESAKARRRILLVTTLAIGAALFVIFVVPRWVPETPGSPGTLVVIALLWVLGSAVIAVALPALLGALTARTRAPQEPE